jgi:hypothetical protein
MVSKWYLNISNTKRGADGREGTGGRMGLLYLCVPQAGPGPLTQSAVADRCSCSTDFSLPPPGVIPRDTVTNPLLEIQDTRYNAILSNKVEIVAWALTLSAKRKTCQIHVCTDCMLYVLALKSST